MIQLNKLVALYCDYIFREVFMSFNLQTKASLQPHLLPVSTSAKCIVGLSEVPEDDCLWFKKKMPLN